MNPSSGRPKGESFERQPDVVPERQAGAPSPWAIGLPPRQFAEAFPFHFAVDAALTILQVGATLRRLCPDVQPGASLDRLFRSLRPDVPITLDWVLEHKARFFLLEHTTSKLQLRGEFVELPGDARLLFLGSPWLTDSSEVAARGLRFEDFAVHDPVVDLLQVFQASKMALADAKKLADKLAVQRAELRATNERLREQQAESRRLALIAARTDNAVILTDAAGLVVWVNEGFTRLTGYALEEMQGRKPGSILQGRHTDPATVGRIRERLRRGEGFTEEILNYRKDGREYWAAIEVQPIPDEQGAVTHYMSIESDVTARRAEQQRMEVQFDVATALAQAIDLPAAIQRVLRVICERLGWQLGQLWQVAEDHLRLLDAWHPESVDIAHFVAASRAMSFRHGEGYPGRVWATGLPCWIADAMSTPDFLRADAARRDGLLGAFAIPVPVRGQVWGVAEFFSAKVERADEALLKIFATIGVQIGEFIVRHAAQEAVREEKRLLEEARRRELRTGFEIQRSLLIGEVPAGIVGADIAGYAEPSRGIDGDFYAFTRFRPDCFELLVGDVMGKGVPAALVGAALRTAYSEVVTELVAGARGDGGLPTPATIVNTLHERLTPRLIELETFVTLALYRFDLADGRLTFVNAGHTPGLLLRGGGGLERILGENLPVGVLEGECYVQASVPMAMGDALLAYSDGLTEASSARDEEFGERRIADFMRGLDAADVPARIALQALRKRVRDYMGERLMRDDETAVLVMLREPLAALESTPGRGVGEEVFDLPWDVGGLEPLRRRVAVAAAGLRAEARDGLVLASHEAATNVVRHVRRLFDDATLTCRLRRQADRVTVELWYVGLQFDPRAEGMPDFSGDSEGGFGLYIIERSVSRVTYDEPVLDVCRICLEQIAGGGEA
jgi:PAS domain S-box-containing protein